MTDRVPERLRPVIFELLPGSGKRELAEATLRRFLEDDTVSGYGLISDVPAAPSALWTATQDRSDLRRIHGFLFAAQWAPLVETLDEATADELRGRLEKLLDSWWSVHRHLDRATAPMAFHDETTAQRLMALLVLRLRLWPYDAPSSLERIVQQCRALLVRDDFYGGRNNHGMFQDLALLADAALSPLDEETRRAGASVAASRLDDFTVSSFTAEGALNEHSPAYHVLVVRSLLLGRPILEHLVDEGVLQAVPDRLSHLLDDAEAYATQVVRPDGTYPPVSDTTSRRLDSPGNLIAFRSPEFRFAVTGGIEGIAPRRRAAAYPDSGVGIFRERWGDQDATYVHFSSGYNGGYHKHSDEMSLYLATAGVELLREAGPYGYNYDDPLTKYAFSSFAHNGLVVDGRTLPRHDGRFDETTMVDLGTTEEVLSVRGRTTRFTGVEYERAVHAESRGSATTVEVHDRIRAGERHRYQLLWHLGPGVRPVVRGDHIELHAAGRQLGELFIASSQPYRLRVVDPSSDDILGWSFPDFGRSRRVHALEVELLEADADVRTTIRTGEFALVDRGIRLLDPATPWRSSGDPKVTSMLVAPDSPSDRLVVAFSAIAPERNFSYNYQRSLEHVDAWRLFVLDDWGVQGAYYHGHARDDRIFRSVQALIARTAAELGIRRERITTVGSSKGGTGALIHGLAAGAGRVVVAAPQTRIGLFTARAHPEVLEYIAGGTTAADAAWADHIVDDRLVDAGPTRVTVLVGDRDPHLKAHVLPFVAASAASAATVDAVVVPGTPHSEIGAMFSSALPKLLQAQDSPTARAACAFRAGPRTAALHVELEPGDRATVKWFRGSELLATAPLSDRRVHLLDDVAPGNVRARVYVRDATGANLEPFTTAAARI